ncbi:anoctamin-10 [Cimex lectularius]|uniref:Anoctamin n=1 Tax=Cimex lectularius TaxID=79782 RepID=A0A8I6RQU8_CIMLE|nr:anoctamin-10 [Cimex lectularius]
MVGKFKEGKTKSFPPTYIVVEFSKKIQLKTAQWLVYKLTGSKQSGGAELIVRKQPSSSSQNLLLHVTCSEEKLLELAEEQEVRKKDKNGVLREFMVDELEEFIEADFKDQLLTAAEKQVLVRHEIENVRALSHEMCILGYTEYPLYVGQSIISACLHYKLIKQVFPLHDQELVKKIGGSWYKSILDERHFEDIRMYFGESIALYFQFLGFYTTALMVPSVLGFLQMILPPVTLAFFCVINIICATLFLELWNRKCSELAYVWGTISMTSFDEPRPNFMGVMGVDVVTGKLLPQAPRFKTHLKMYCVSLPLVVLCMIGAFGVMLFSFWVEDLLKQIPSIPQWVVYAPSVVYAVVVVLMNLVYRRFATFLTEWENHRTQSQYDRHRVTKLVLFEFVNNFMSLFYIAFVIQDIELLRYQLATLLIMLQILNNFQETVYPLAIHYFQKSSKAKQGSPYKELVSQIVGIEEIDSEDFQVKHALEQRTMVPYDDPYDDYLELFVQFGYVFLFSAVYPMAAFWAYVNNFFEMGLDAYKLCNFYQRPMARKVKDTGAWQRLFKALCALSVMTNCLLLSLSPALRDAAPSFSETSWFLNFVILEHILLALRQILHYAIPDKPEWVKIALAKGNYLSKQALKMQRQLKNKANIDSVTKKTLEEL